MLYTVVVIDWTGQTLTGEQITVIRNFAAEYLLSGTKRESFNFSHQLCTGRIEPKHEGTFGTYAGTFFHVYLGTVSGKPWTFNFLLPRGTELLDPEELCEATGLPLLDYNHDRRSLTEIDVHKAAIRTRHPNRSRAMN